MKRRSAVRIPWRAPTDRRLRGRELHVLCALCMHAGDKGWTRVSQVQLGKQLGCGRSTIQRCINKLIATGYLKRKNRTKINGRQVWHPFSPHTFHIIFAEAAKD